MRRLLAAAVASAALVVPATAARAAYYRACGGVVDYQCNGSTCSLDCFPRPCLAWLDPNHNPHLAVCVPPLGGVA
jgi:hypothetical protein